MIKLSRRPDKPSLPSRRLSFGDR
jgi:hypothetical protein